MYIGRRASGTHMGWLGPSIETARSRARARALPAFDLHSILSGPRYGVTCANPSRVDVHFCRLGRAATVMQGTKGQLEIASLLHKLFLGATGYRFVDGVFRCSVPCLTADCVCKECVMCGYWKF